MRKAKYKPKIRRIRAKFHRPEYTSLAYQNFVKLVRERDEMRCQFPGCKRHRFGIEVHHIIRWQDNVALRYSVMNGICLCNRCHKRVTGNETAYAPLFFQIVNTNTIKQGYRHG